jgi:hypothetical protein
VIACHATTQASATAAAIAPPRHPNSNAIMTTGIVFRVSTASAFEAAVARSVIVATKTTMAAATIRARRLENVMDQQ